MACFSTPLAISSYSQRTLSLRAFSGCQCKTTGSVYGRQLGRMPRRRPCLSGRCPETSEPSSPSFLWAAQRAPFSWSVPFSGGTFSTRPPSCSPSPVSVLGASLDEYATPALRRLMLVFISPGCSQSPQEINSRSKAQRTSTRSFQRAPRELRKTSQVRPVYTPLPHVYTNLATTHLSLIVLLDSDLLRSQSHVHHPGTTPHRDRNGRYHFRKRRLRISSWTSHRSSVSSGIR